MVRLTGFLFFVTVFLTFYFTVIEKENEKTNYPYKMKIYFPRVDGVREGTEVSVLGILSGKVKSLKEIPISRVTDRRYLGPTDEKAVEILVVLNQPLTLWDNYSISFKSKTVFSGRTIDIDPGDFRGEESSQFQPTFAYDQKHVFESPSARYYDDFFSGSFVLLDENRNDLRKSVKNLRSISEKLKGKKGTIPLLINSDEMYYSLHSTGKDLSLIATEGRRYVEMNRDLDTSPLPFTFNLLLNLTGLNLLSQ